MGNRYHYNASGHFKGFSSSTPPSSGCLGLIVIAIVIAIVTGSINWEAILGNLTIILFLAILVGGIGWFCWWAISSFYSSANARSDVKAAAEIRAIEAQQRIQNAKRLTDERQRLSAITTSSSRSIPGRRIACQIKTIFVDNHTSQDDAELAFLRQVAASGADGVINMRFNRHRGGYFSIQGDSVKLLPPDERNRDRA